MSFAICQAAEDAAAAKRPASKKRGRSSGHTPPFCSKRLRAHNGLQGQGRSLTRHLFLLSSSRFSLSMRCMRIRSDPGAYVQVCTETCLVILLRSLVPPEDAPKGLFLEKPSPLSFAKSIKNKAELAGMREAHLRDSVALAETLHHLEQEVRFALPLMHDIAENLAVKC